MSYSTSTEPARSLDELGTSHHVFGQDDTSSLQGYRHDRALLQEQNTSDMSASDQLNITTGQRMISATVGSVLTSLLGTSWL